VFNWVRNLLGVSGVCRVVKGGERYKGQLVISLEAGAPCPGAVLLLSGDTNGWLVAS